MIRITTVAVATIIGLGGACALDKGDKSPIEQLTSYSPRVVTPTGKEITAHDKVPPGWQEMSTNNPTHAVIKPADPTPGWHRKVVLYREDGGHLGEHWDRFKLYNDRNDEVEVRGPCYSACTVVLSLMPRERLCFGEKASLHFHLARYADGKPAMGATHLMYQSYPDDIRGWLDSKGGENNMPLNEFWSLLASDLWKMGYKKCSPG